MALEGDERRHHRHVVAVPREVVDERLQALNVLAAAQILPAQGRVDGLDDEPFGGGWSAGGHFFEQKEFSLFLESFLGPPSLMMDLHCQLLGHLGEALALLDPGYRRNYSQRVCSHDFLYINVLQKRT